MASLPLACTPTRSSNFKQNHNIVLHNPTSKLFDRLSSTHTNKPFHLNVLGVSAKTPKRNSTKIKAALTSEEVKNGSVNVKKKAEIEQNVKYAPDDVKKVREEREKHWKLALKTLLTQIESIRIKIETYFMDKPDEAIPMLKILEDVKSLVEIHNANVGLKKHIPTTDAAMKVAQHFQAYKQSKRRDGLIPVDNVKPKKHTFSPMIDMFTELANLLYGQRGENMFLQGNFAPIREETPPTEVKVVEGEVPSCIKGMMLRNGPNPQHDPVAKYGWLDGDGMVHATYFKDGKVTYASRYTQTSRFRQEQITGRSEFPKYGDYEGAFGVFSAFAQLLKSVFVLDTSYGQGVANENLVYHNGMLLALEDFDRPYAINIKKDGDLETLGVYDFKKKLSHNITPHTKKDPKTGEWFVFGASYTEPYMTYRVVAADGSISDPVDIDVAGPTYMHDFGITSNYVIIMDLAYTFSPEAMLKYNDWIYNINPLKKPRFGIRKRNPKEDDEVKWFEMPQEETFFIYHNANSWEEKDGKVVVLYGCRLGAKKTEKDANPTIKSIFQSNAFVGENLTIEYPELYKYTFNLETLQATSESVATNKIDYTKINEKYMTRKSRYVYACEFIEGSVDAAKIKAILKYDLEAAAGARVKDLTFGEKIFGSEVSFVPSNNAIEEDDGYLLTYVHDEKKGASYVYVICAKKMEKVAVLELPNRVPYGFHSIFIDEVDLARQKKFEAPSRKTDDIIRNFFGSSKGTFNVSWTEDEIAHHD